MVYHFCEHAKTIEVDYRGWITLVDIENIECHIDQENPQIVERGQCPYCTKKEVAYGRR